jgi:hypothetical protein
MFTRVVAVRTKKGKSGELAKTIRHKILPILKTSRDSWTRFSLCPNTESDQILSLSFWKSRQDAERYTHEEYPRVNELISHSLRAHLSPELSMSIFSPVTMITRGKGGKAA